MGGNPPDSKWHGYSTPRGERTRRGIELTLPDESRTKLEAMAKRLKLSRSEVVEMLIRESKK